MIINKNQDQSLNKIVLYLEDEIFTHDQLYVALSKVISPKVLHMLIHDSISKYPNHIKKISCTNKYYIIFTKLNSLLQTKINK